MIRAVRLGQQEIYRNLSSSLPLEQIHVFDEIDSTNTYAKQCAENAGMLRDKNGALTVAGRKLHCSVYIADTQTAGRGRMGRSFFSPKESGLYLSLVYCPENGVQNPARWTAVSSVAVCRALEHLCGADCRVKWVNDIFVRGKKVCGILTEGICNPATSRVEAVVVGIGINVFYAPFPPELTQIAGAVFHESDGVNRNKLAAEIITRLLDLFSKGEKQEDAMNEYRNRSATVGTEVTVYPSAGGDKGAYKAKAVDITKDAELVVETENGERRILKSGEVAQTRI